MQSQLRQPMTNQSCVLVEDIDFVNSQFKIKYDCAFAPPQQNAIQVEKHVHISNKFCNLLVVRIVSYATIWQHLNHVSIYN